MVDTFRPLLVSREALALEDAAYQALVARAAVVTTASARALLAGLVDYAGLFPPAALSTWTRRWRSTRAGARSPEAWMLGRFVVPAGAARELARAADAHLPDAGAGEPWRAERAPRRRRRTATRRS